MVQSHSTQNDGSSGADESATETTIPVQGAESASGAHVAGRTGCANRPTGAVLHTPGPWYYRVRGDGFVIRSKQAQGPIVGVSASHAEAQANVSLLVAAPEMLAALNDALLFIETEMRWAQPSIDAGEEPADRFTYDAIPVAHSIRTTIAKAHSLSEPSS